jgi:hypothetical protein
MTRSSKSVFGALTALVVAAGMQVFVAAAPANAATCYGVECDDVGPQGAGCFGDQQTVASNPSGPVRLRYSKVCKAFWAAAPAWDPCFQTKYIHLEMDQFIDGRWVNRRRLIETARCSDGDDWTNALGGRNQFFRFRAILVEEFNTHSYFTQWVCVNAQANPIVPCPANP